MGSTARDVTNAQAPTAGPDMALPGLERAFPKEGVTRFPVVDQDGRLAGIVSALDFVRLFADGRVASA